MKMTRLPLTIVRSAVKTSLCLYAAMPGSSDAVWLDCVPNCKGAAGCEAPVTQGGAPADQHNVKPNGNTTNSQPDSSKTASSGREGSPSGLGIRPHLLTECGLPR